MKKEEPKEWKIILYQTETGKCPFDDFIATLTEGRQVERRHIRTTDTIKRQKKDTHIILFLL